jgi:stage III sporulation protein SpoIIIAA
LFAVVSTLRDIPSQEIRWRREWLMMPDKMVRTTVEHLFSQVAYLAPPAVGRQTHVAMNAQSPPYPGAIFDDGGSRQTTPR